MACGTQFVFQIGGSGCIPISAKDVNGAAVNTTGLPTVLYMTLNSVGVDPNTVAYAVAVTQVQDDTPASVTGEYQLCFDVSQFSAGDIIQFGIQAVIGGVTLTTTESVLIKDDAAERPTLC